MRGIGPSLELSGIRAASWSFALVALLAFPEAALAAACSVPGTHISIQSAVDDPTCSEIDLAPQAYAESVIISRTLTLSGVAGPSSILRGPMTVTGEVSVGLNDLRVSSGGAGPAVLLTGGAMVTTRRVEVRRNGGFPWIFADGFESGDTGAWTSTAN